MKILDFIKKHSVVFYFLLTFAITWGGFIWTVGGLSGFPGAPEDFEKMMPKVVLAMLAGPSISGLLFTYIVNGKKGLRNLFSELFKWRLNIWWYVLAILATPILVMTVSSLLSVPTFFSASEDKVAVLVMGLVAWVSVVMEEIGWTGFAIPKLREKFSILKTSLIVGSLWGLWHLLQGIWIGGTYAGSVPFVTYMILNFLIGALQLTAFRVFLVWAYDRTKSLLLVTLFHGSLSAATVILFRPLNAGLDFLIYTFTITMTVCAAVGVLYLLNKKELLNKPIN